MQTANADALAALSTISATYPSTVWMADLDDTLIDTVKMHNHASRAILHPLRQFLDEKRAEQLVGRFGEIFRVLHSSHQSDSLGDEPRCGDAERIKDELQARIEGCQQELRKQWGMIKLFSRETLLKLAGEDCGILLTPDQIQQCADSYWEDLESHTIFFDDALKLATTIARVGSPFFLFTSSDARLTLKANGQFNYNPASSRSFKRMRIEKLRPRGLLYTDVFIGDPLDKPTPEFFNMVYDSIEKALGQQVDASRIIVLGDSYDSDLKIPVSDWKIALGIIYRHGLRDVVLRQERIVALGTWNVVSELIPTA